MAKDRLELPMDEFAIAVGNENKRLREEVSRLEARLEVDPRHSYDGIYCRDETIKLLEERIDNLRSGVKWRPIEDNPPLERHVMLAIRVVDFIHACVGYYDSDEACWKSSETDEPLSLTPDYWMDVPPLPKDEE